MYDGELREPSNAELTPFRIILLVTAEKQTLPEPPLPEPKGQ